jgi:hypothetical protein
MSEFNFEVWLARVPAERGADLPTMPVETAVREARSLFDVVDLRRDEFTGLATFDVAFIDALPVLATKLSDAESAWLRQKLVATAASVRPVRDAAEGFRSDFLASARYMLRNDPPAIQLLDQIAEGSGLDDLTEDLEEIARLGEERQDVLAADKQLPKELPAYARSLAQKLSTVKESPAAQAALEQRNRVFWLLDQAVGEVRAAGRYLYRKEPKTLALMGSDYVNRRAQRSRSARAAAKATSTVKSD